MSQYPISYTDSYADRSTHPHFRQTNEVQCGQWSQWNTHTSLRYHLKFYLLFQSHILWLLCTKRINGSITFQPNLFFFPHVSYLQILIAFRLSMVLSKKRMYKFNFVSCPSSITSAVHMDEIEMLPTFQTAKRILPKIGTGFAVLSSTTYIWNRLFFSLINIWQNKIEKSNIVFALRYEFWRLPLLHEFDTRPIMGNRGRSCLW